MTAEEYLRQVGFRLRDLPWKTRRQLLTEIRDHLAELPEDSDLAERLGPPDRYAADLRSSAGLERRRGPIAFLRARRPRNVILVTLALVVLGLTIGAAAWVDSYQPLGFSGAMTLPAGAAAVPTGGELAVFHEGRPFQYGVSIENTGRFAVRILGVPEPSILPVSARLFVSEPWHYPRPLSNTGLRLFKPFDLQPGEERLLVLRGVYRTNRTLCGSGLRWGGAPLVQFPVRFSFLWRTTTVLLDVPPDQELYIRIPHKGYRGAPIRGCR